jgi:flagellar motor switch protein FliM
MPDSLTQKDVDALIKGGTPSPSSAKREIVPYNFAHPPRVSRDRRTGLEAIYSRFGLSLQALLSSRLRTAVDVDVAGIEQTMFAEYLYSLVSPCAAYVFTTGDALGGQGVLDLGTEVAYHLVDRLFGGPGESDVPKRPLTSLERTVLKSIADRIVGFIREAWQEELPLSPEVVSFESNPDSLNVLNREANVLVAHLVMRSMGFTGLITICLPMTTIEPFLQEPAAHAPMRHARSETSRDRGAIQSVLQHAQLLVTARLPAIKLSTRSIVELTPGQVLMCGHPVDAPIEVQVNGRVRFRGTLGQSRRRLGVRITQDNTLPVSDRPAFIREGRLS